MAKLYLVYNNMSSLDVGVLIKSRVIKPIPNREYEEIKVPNMDGLLHTYKGLPDIPIPVTFNFVSESADDFDNYMRNIKRWLLSKVDNKLMFSDDLLYYYKVKKINIDTPERLIKRLGRFTVTFTCDPYSYLIDGLIEQKLTYNFFNSFEKCFPTYVVKGEGLLKLNINGNEIKANVGQKLTINTEKGLCYRLDSNVPSNTDISGYYEDMILLQGENRFSFNSGFDIKIIPNWRCY